MKLLKARRSAIALLLAAAFTLSGASAAMASVPFPEDPSDPRNFVDVPAGPAVLNSPQGPGLRSTVYNVTCTVDVRETHYSTGAGGAIYKNGVKCTGTGLATVSVRVRGILQLDYATSPTDTSPIVWVQRATSDQTRTVTVNGGELIYYTPLPGSHGGTGTGFWYGHSTIQIVAPSVGTVGSGSYIKWKTI